MLIYLNVIIFKNTFTVRLFHTIRFETAWQLYRFFIMLSLSLKFLKYLTYHHWNYWKSSYNNYSAWNPPCSLIKPLSWIWHAGSRKRRRTLSPVALGRPTMSILDQTRALPHIAGMPPGSQPIMPPHAMDGPPNSEVLLALLARNKALEGKSLQLSHELRMSFGK